MIVHVQIKSPKKPKKSSKSNYDTQSNFLDLFADEVEEEEEEEGEEDIEADDDVIYRCDGQEYNEIINTESNNAESSESTETKHPVNCEYFFYVIYRSKKHYERTINLLCYAKSSTEPENQFRNGMDSLDAEFEDYHYCYITSLSRLVGSQKSKHSSTHLVCESCLTFHHNEAALERHSTYCVEHDAVRVKVSPKGSVIKFKNYKALSFVKFAVYFDIESFAKDIPIDENSNLKTFKEKIHIPYSIGAHIKSRCTAEELLSEELEQMLGKYVYFRSENCIEQFFDLIFEYGKPISEYLHTKHKINFT